MTKFQRTLHTHIQKIYTKTDEVPIRSIVKSTEPIPVFCCLTMCYIYIRYCHWEKLGKEYIGSLSSIFATSPHSYIILKLVRSWCAWVAQWVLAQVIILGSWDQALRWAPLGRFSSVYPPTWLLTGAHSLKKKKPALETECLMGPWVTFIIKFLL